MKYFDININKQNPDQYPIEKIEPAVRSRSPQPEPDSNSSNDLFGDGILNSLLGGLLSGQMMQPGSLNRDIGSPQPFDSYNTDRGIYSSSNKNKPPKHKPKYRPSKLLYGVGAYYLWREKQKLWAVGLLVAFFFQKSLANSGHLEMLSNMLISKFKGNSNNGQIGYSGYPGSGQRALSNGNGSGSEGTGVDFSQFDLD